METPTWSLIITPADRPPLAIRFDSRSEAYDAGETALRHGAAYSLTLIGPWLRHGVPNGAIFAA